MVLRLSLAKAAAEPPHSQKSSALIGLVICAEMLPSL
jgi:hypothetical protein